MAKQNKQGNGLNDIECYKWYIDYAACPITVKRIGGKVNGEVFIHRIYSKNATVSIRIEDLFDTREDAVAKFVSDLQEKRELVQYWDYCLDLMLENGNND